MDHATSKIDIYHQLSLGGSDTVCNKELYEQKEGEHGVKIQSYRGDNGVFKYQVFQYDIKKRNQLLAFSGVGIHGQNGVADQAIQTVVISARTMMLHQAALWPEQFHMRLWPFFITHAAYLWNHLPGMQGLSPLEMYLGKK